MFQGVYDRSRIVIKAYGFWALGLALPIYCLYAAHFLLPPEGMVATGFLHWDMPYYMANAREHFDHGFSLTYGLPFSPFDETPKIYAQPFTLVMGALHYLTGIEPGYLFAGFGLVMAILCCGLTAAIYDRLIGLQGKLNAFGLVLLMWGGGLFTLFSLSLGLDDGDPVLSQLLRFDPFNGNWFLNLGRNLAFSTEALYHALALAALLSVLVKRYGIALICLGALSASHPFTGLQINGIFSAWAILTLVFLPSTAPPRFFAFGTIAIIALHVLYYLVFLPTSAEHRDIMDMWALAWVLPGTSMLLAYGPVLIGAGVTLYFHWQRKWSFYAPETLLLLVLWAIISALLAKHELFITPHQPLHFTRGYIWLPLALLALPAVLSALRALRRESFVAAMISCAVLGMVMLADNVTWFTKQIVTRADNYVGYVPIELKQVLGVLNRSEEPIDRVVGVDYFVGIYTPYRTWAGRVNLTPSFDRRSWEAFAFVDSGRIPLAWQSETIAFVVTPEQKQSLAERWPDQFTSLYKGKDWHVLSADIDTLCRSAKPQPLANLSLGAHVDFTDTASSHIYLSDGWRPLKRGLKLIRQEAGLSFQMNSWEEGGQLEFEVDRNGVARAGSAEVQVLFNGVPLGAINLDEGLGGKKIAKFLFPVEERHLKQGRLTSCNGGPDTVELTLRLVDKGASLLDLSPNRFKGHIQSLRLVTP